MPESYMNLFYLLLYTDFPISNIYLLKQKVILIFILFYTMIIKYINKVN